MGKELDQCSDPPTSRVTISFTALHSAPFRTEINGVAERKDDVSNTDSHSVLFYVGGFREDYI